MKRKHSKINISEIIIYSLCFIFLIGIITWVVISNINDRYANAYEDNFILTGPGSIVEDLKKLHPKVESMNWKGHTIKSFTINKKETFICLKDKKGEYYPRNHLMYVAIHELAHAICPSIGHTQEWSRIFEDLLIKAEKLGIYDPKIPQPDYSDCMGH